jgi:hypothetical protein
MGEFAYAASENEALEHLHAQNLTDGLPVVVPTRARIKEMILACGLEADISLGDIGPSMAAATVEVVAANAVMAGCLPEHFPVVVAAVKAIADPEYDLSETQVTTHPVTPLLIVNGPAREACGLAWGTGAFGPGHRANASIGRAIRLVMMNVGGGRPGISDMATLGSPAKFSFCAAENEEQSPWEPLHVSRGFARERSTVTALSVEGPHSVICAPVPQKMADQAAPCAIRIIGNAVGALTANSTFFNTGDIAVIINPLTARMLCEAGYSRLNLQHALADAAAHTRGELRRYNPGLISAGDDDDIFKRDPDTIVILCSGPMGGYSMVCPTLGVSQHHHRAVTKEIDINQVCLIPQRG